MRCTSFRQAWRRRLRRTPRWLAVEQRHVEVLLQRPDAVADGGRGDAGLLGGAGEALVAGRGLEEAQAIERGQEQHAGKTSGQGAMTITGFRLCRLARGQWAVCVVLHTLIVAKKKIFHLMAG